MIPHFLLNLFSFYLRTKFELVINIVDGKTMMIVKVEKLISTDLLHRNQDEKNEQRRSRKSSYSP